MYQANQIDLTTLTVDQLLSVARKEMRRDLYVNKEILVKFLIRQHNKAKARNAVAV